MIMIQAAL